MYGELSLLILKSFLVHSITHVENIWQYKNEAKVKRFSSNWAKIHTSINNYTNDVSKDPLNLLKAQRIENGH